VAKRKSSYGNKFNPVSIPIHSLSGGVGRQIPTKRLPNEAETLVNVMCTTESSIDKRNGIEHFWDNGDPVWMPTPTGDVGSGKDIWMDFIDLGDKKTGLVRLNLSPGRDLDDILRVWELNEDGTGSEMPTQEITEADLWGEAWERGDTLLALAYLAYDREPHNWGNPNMQERLRMVQVGSSVLLLNTDVKAGFTSSGDKIPEWWESYANIVYTYGWGDTDIYKKSFNGKPWTNYNPPYTFHIDTQGREVVYETSRTVDPKGEAVPWVQSDDYTWGELVIDEEDSMADISALGPWETKWEPYNYHATASFTFGSVPFRGTYGMDRATATFTFGDTWPVDGATIQIIDTEAPTHFIFEIDSDSNVTGTNIAVTHDEAEANGGISSPDPGAGRGMAKAFADAVNNADDLGITASYNTTTGTVILQQYAPGTSGHTAITADAAFDAGCTVNPPDAFTGGDDSTPPSATDAEAAGPWIDISTAYPTADTVRFRFVGPTGPATSTLVEEGTDNCEDNYVAVRIPKGSVVSDVATQLANAINNTTTGLGEANADGGVIAYHNQEDWDDTTSSPGKVVIKQREHNIGHPLVEATPTAGNLPIAYSLGVNGNGASISYSAFTSDDPPPKFTGGRDITDSDGNFISDGSYPETPHRDDIYIETWDGYKRNGGKWYPPHSVGGDDIADPLFPYNDPTSDPYDASLRKGIWRVREDVDVLELPGPTNVAIAEANNRENGSQLRPRDDLFRWERVPVDVDDLDPDGTDYNFQVSNQTLWSNFIKVEDHIWPDPDKPELGHNVSKFSDLALPPSHTHIGGWNGREGGPFGSRNSGELTYPPDYPAGDTEGEPLHEYADGHHQQIGDFGSVTKMLSELHPYVGETEPFGRGKIIHLRQPYLGNQKGWYRTVSTFEKPYLQNIRTPHRRSLIDKDRMPMMLYRDHEDKWGLRPVNWDPRTTGDTETNPGPSLFVDPLSGEARETRIQAISYYRDRLFLAAHDTLVSSQAGDWDNFWLYDAETLSDIDPIDLRLSSNDYSEIKWLTPFRNFLFVSTEGDKQFELIGDGDLITPANAELAPTSSFPQGVTAPPVVMNNNVFFAGSRKLFVYFGQKDLTVQQAYELSRHVPSYIPENIENITHSPAHGIIFMQDKDNPGCIYLYRNQIAGDRIIQNAFFKWILPSFVYHGDSLQKIKAVGNYLYIASPTMPIGRIDLRIDHTKPKMDWSRSFWSAAPDVDWTFDPDMGQPGTGYSSFSIPNQPDNFNPIPLYNRCITGANDWPGDTVTYNEVQWAFPTFDSDTGKWVMYMEGRVNPAAVDISLTIGYTFDTAIELSPIYVRDQQNNIVNGVLSISYGTIRYTNTGEFTVKVGHVGRELDNNDYDWGWYGKPFQKRDYHFNPDVLSDTDTWYGGPYTNRPSDQELYGIDPSGVFKFPVRAKTDKLRIILFSNSPRPLNVAQMEFVGKFNPSPIHISS
jgi:hypothetical protein